MLATSYFFRTGVWLKVENKWSFILIIQPIVGLLLVLIGIYTFIVGSPELLPWAFMLMGPLFLTMGFYEMRRQNKNPSTLYFGLAIVSFLFGYYSFAAF